MVLKVLLFVLQAITVFSLNGKDIPYVYNKTRPLILAHRGSPGHFPEHTFGSHSDAFFQNADFLEGDLQVTKDFKLIVQHEPCLKQVTNIESLSQFQDRKRAHWQYQMYNCEDDWFINDFTLAELKTIKNKQRVPTRNQELNNIWSPITLEEWIELAFKLNSEFPRDREYPTGLYIETKMPEYYESIGINMNQLFYDVLKKYNLASVKDCQNRLPIVLQSFYNSSLLFFNQITDLPRIQLLRDGSIIDWDFFATYAHGVGPQDTFIFNKYKVPTDFIKKSHQYNLLVHPWIIRDDQLIYADNAIDENLLYVVAGADGLFTEFPQVSYESVIRSL